MTELSEAQARDKFDQLRAQYSKYHKNVKENRKFYNRDFENMVISPAVRKRGFKAVIPRTARRSVDEATDHILFRPKVRVPVRPTNSKHTTEQSIAEKKRKALNAWWRQVEQRFHPIGDGRKWILIDGAVAVRMTLNWDMVPDKDDPKYRQKLAKLGRYGFLWNIELMNNEWVYVDPSNHRDPAYAYVHYNLRVEEAKRRWPEATGEWRTRPDYEKVNYLEYWSKPTFTDDGEWEPGIQYQWVDRDCVKSDINPYPYVPIAVEDSGWGLVHASADPHEKFVGLNEHSHDVFVAQARQWSAMQAVTENTAFNPVVARNFSDEEMARLTVGPGSIWNLEGAENDPNRQSIEFLTWPNIPLTVLQMIQMTDREVNGALKTDTLGGIAQTGVDTATEADQNVRNAAAKLSSPVAALERLVAKMSRWMLMDIELVLEAPVTLYGVGADDEADITLTPREINGYYDVSCELRTQDEEALSLTKARFWMEMYRVSPMLSAYTAMERGEIADDPQKEMLRRAAEDVFLSEEFRMVRVMSGAESMQQLMEMVTAMQQENAKPAGPPSGPAGPASDLGLISQDTLDSPTQDRVVSDALIRRDTEQAGAALRGPQG